MAYINIVNQIQKQHQQSSGLLVVEASSAAESSSLSEQVNRLCPGRCGAGCIRVTLMDPLCCKQLPAGAANGMEPWERAKTFRLGHKPRER